MKFGSALVCIVVLFAEGPRGTAPLTLPRPPRAQGTYGTQGRDVHKLRKVLKSEIRFFVSWNYLTHRFIKLQIWIIFYKFNNILKSLIFIENIDSLYVANGFYLTYRFIKLEIWLILIHSTIFVIQNFDSLSTIYIAEIMLVWKLNCHGHMRPINEQETVIIISIF